MKKIKYGLMVGMCTLVLTACGDGDQETDAEENASNNDITNEGSETNNDPEENDNDQQEEANESGEENNQSEENIAVEGDGSLVEEILVRSIEAMADVTSYTVQMDTESNIIMDGEEMATTSSITMDIVIEPRMHHQIVKMTDSFTGQETEIEQYLDEDGYLYMYDEFQDHWMKMENLFGAAAITGTEEDLEPGLQLEMLEGFIDILSVEEEGDHYVLRVEGAGEEMAALYSGFATEGEGGAEMENMMSMFDIQHMDYVMYINKDTYYQDETIIEMEIEMDMGEDTISSADTTRTTFSNFNAFDTIDIPQDILDNAVDDLSGQ